jgi:hypothetical protein
MAITLSEAKALTHGTILHRRYGGRCLRWRVNGVVKTWKTRPDDVQVPLKHGLYSYGYLRDSDLDAAHLESQCPFELEV